MENSWQFENTSVTADIALLFLLDQRTGGKVVAVMITTGHQLAANTIKLQFRSNTNIAINSIINSFILIMIFSCV